MSQEGVRKVVGRIIADPQFQQQFHQDPNKAIASAGYAVSPEELTALSKIKPGDLQLAINKRPGIGGVASFSVESFTGVRTA